MKRQVVMWHGYTDSLFDDLIKLVGCTTEKNEDTTTNTRDLIYFDGSLDDFIERWKRPIIVNYEHKYIAVTQFKSFGQR